MSKVALVTGGSGALGGAIVRQFREDGHAVAFTFMRNEDAACTLAEETDAVAFQADLTDCRQVKATDALATHRALQSWSDRGGSSAARTASAGGPAKKKATTARKKR